MMRKGFVAVMFFLVAACSAPSGQPETNEGSMPQTNNHIDYVEFSASDLSVVKAFYSKAFGWEFQDWGDDYVSFSSAGLDGGFHVGEASAPSGALVILYADDLEQSEKNVVDAGGEITEHHEFPGGRRFHFRDPVGNVLGVWTKVETAAEGE